MASRSCLTVSWLPVLIGYIVLVSRWKMMHFSAARSIGDTPQPCLECAWRIQCVSSTSFGTWWSTWACLWWRRSWGLACPNPTACRFMHQRSRTWESPVADGLIPATLDCVVEMVFCFSTGSSSTCRTKPGTAPAMQIRFGVGSPKSARIALSNESWPGDFGCDVAAVSLTTGSLSFFDVGTASQIAGRFPGLWSSNFSISSRKTAFATVSPFGGKSSSLNWKTSMQTHATICDGVAGVISPYP